MSMLRSERPQGVKHEGEMDRQAIGVRNRVNPARQVAREPPLYW